MKLYGPLGKDNEGCDLLFFGGSGARQGLEVVHVRFREMDANGDGEVDSQDFLLDETSVVRLVCQKFASRLRLVFQEFSLFFLSMDREILDEVSRWKTMEVNVFWIKMTRCVGCAHFDCLPRFFP